MVDMMIYTMIKYDQIDHKDRHVTWHVVVNKDGQVSSVQNPVETGFLLSKRFSEAVATASFHLAKRAAFAIWLFAFASMNIFQPT